jgi:hypothetical protein
MPSFVFYLYMKDDWGEIGITFFPSMLTNPICYFYKWMIDFFLTS